MEGARLLYNDINEEEEEEEEYQSSSVWDTLSKLAHTYNLYKIIML